jgi:UDP-N-acetylglucosamine 3-dehydrogenase
MKVLLIGLGRWGERHLRVLGELGVDLWVADLSEERRALAVRAGIVPARVLADHRAALQDVDAVDLVTPADTHLPLGAECLRAGKDCFIEKPLALSVAEGHRLLEIQRSAGRILQVGHIFRFHPVTEVLRRWLGSGAAGAVRHCTGRFSGFKRPRADVGVTQTDALHYFDLFAHLLGQAPTAVTATLRDHLGRGMDDCSFSTVEYGPVPAFIEAGYFAPGTHRDCVIVGERTTAAADFGASEVRLHANRHVLGPAGWQAPEGAVETIKASGPEPLRRELELFLGAVARREPPPVDVEAGLLALRTVEAARRSSELGRRVTLPEIDPTLVEMEQTPSP